MDLWTSLFPGQFILLQCFVEILVVNTNSVDADQMPHSVVSNFESALFASYPFGCLQTKMGSGIFSNYGMQMG